jgi:hypothetical protein
MRGQAAGYALIDQEGVPLPSTVATTERGAMANALVAVFGRYASAADSDRKIKADFVRLKPPGFCIGAVAIERVALADAAPKAEGHVPCNL